MHSIREGNIIFNFPGRDRKSLEGFEFLAK